MLTEAKLESYLLQLATVGASNQVQIQDLKRKGLKMPPLTFLMRLMSALELAPQVIALGSALAKRVIISRIHVKRGNLHRLLTACIILAEKYLEDDANKIESYSLVVGLPIKEILSLEIKVYEWLEFSMKVDEREVSLLYSQALADRTKRF